MRDLFTREGIANIEGASKGAGLPERQLMDTAGKALAHKAAELASQGRIVCLCGPGNNGGDGWVAAQALSKAGRDVTVICAEEPCGKGLAARVAAAAMKAGVEHTVDTGDGAALMSALGDAGLVIDAMFGAGFHGQLPEPFRTWADIVTESGVPALACDLPSGMEADGPACAEGTIPALASLATIGAKVGMVAGRDSWRCGEIVVEDLGCADAVPEAMAQEVLCSQMSAGEYRDLLPMPAWDANKYSRGHALMIAGSRAYPGAAVLCTKAAARSGAGYVTVAVPETIADIVRTCTLSTPVRSCRALDGAFAEEGIDEILELAQRCDGIAVGPGLTVVACGTVPLVSALLAQCTKPLLLDADAVNVVSRNPEYLLRRGACGYATVLTPHAGERRRLLSGFGIDVEADEHDDIVLRIENDRRFAELTGAVIVDKGPDTVVVSPGRAILYPDGPRALATCGTGDVLTGIIGSLLACKLPPADAAATGVCLHGLAASIAVRSRTMMCMTAEDLIDTIPLAVGELLDGEDGYV